VFRPPEELLYMTSKLSASRIVRKLAEQVCHGITRRAIRALQHLKNGLQSGDDSGLTNAREEICAQIQVEQSFSWDAYDETVRQIAFTEVNQLEPHEQDAVWLQTPEGKSWDAGDEDAREQYPVAEDHIVEYVMNEFIYSAAADWSVSVRFSPYRQIS